MISSIEIINLSKTYRIYRKPSDRLKEFIYRKSFHKAFYALSGLSLNVLKGESIGIVGYNGAGKSTLMKIVAGTLRPTSGELNVRGRVAALLELGAGFHKDFTGRQNIWMNASLMGLKKEEIRKKEETIIDFSELDEFIDRPIKTYSSGMVMRLAFSIATSVDPDILVIDEALSVGDHYFQKKCIDRMMNFKKSHKTLLFCSHSMHLVNQLCDRAMWVDGGCIKKLGPAMDVTADYENYGRKKSSEGLAKTKFITPNKDDGNPSPVVVTSVLLNGCEGALEIEQGSDLQVDIHYACMKDIDFIMAAGIRRNDALVCHITSMKRFFDFPIICKAADTGKVSLLYKALPFFHGEFSVVAFAMDAYSLHCFHQKASADFRVRPMENWDNEMGLLKLEHDWCIE